LRELLEYRWSGDLEGAASARERLDRPPTGPGALCLLDERRLRDVVERFADACLDRSPGDDLVGRALARHVKHALARKDEVRERVAARALHLVFAGPLELEGRRLLERLPTAVARRLAARFASRPSAPAAVQRAMGELLMACLDG